MNITKQWIQNFDDELSLREVMLDKIEGKTGYLKNIHLLETEDLCKLCIALNITIK